MNTISGAGCPVVVGEVLYDVFSDGRKVLGGAPFNVAWNLQALGLEPLLVTRVGCDDDGDAVVAAMDGWGMATAGVQRDDTRPTGRVEVREFAGEPTFEIVPDQAYDGLDAGPALDTISQSGARILYHGSLVLRSDSSRHALEAVRARCGAPVFIDVNLRDPWWDAAEVLEMARRSTWIKLNQAELARLVGRKSADDAFDTRASAESFRVRTGASTVIVTLGMDGALLVERDRSVSGRPPDEVEVIDTVGAGDAFSAVTILGLIRGWPGETILRRALEFASAICAVRGATTLDRSVYRTWKQRWEGDER